jgi:hypothetical protein
MLCLYCYGSLLCRGPRSGPGRGKGHMHQSPRPRICRGRQDRVRSSARHDRKYNQLAGQQSPHIEEEFSYGTARIYQYGCDEADQSESGAETSVLWNEIRRDMPGGATVLRRTVPRHVGTRRRARHFSPIDRGYHCYPMLACRALPGTVQTEGIYEDNRVLRSRDTHPGCGV